MMFRADKDVDRIGPLFESVLKLLYQEYSMRGPHEVAALAARRHFVTEDILR